MARRWARDWPRYSPTATYSRARYRLYFIGIGWEIAILLGLLFLRVPPALRDAATAVSPARSAEVLIYVPLLLAILILLGLPLAMYGHALAIRQSLQPWASWLWEWTSAVALQPPADRRADPLRRRFAAASP